MTYAKPEQPVLRTPRRRPSPRPRESRKVLTRVAADSVRDMAIAWLTWWVVRKSTRVGANPEERLSGHPPGSATGRASRAARPAPAPNPGAHRGSGLTASFRGAGLRARTPRSQYGGIRRLENGHPSHWRLPSADEIAPRSPRSRCPPRP